MNLDRLLLDTHVLVWWATDSAELPAATADIIERANDVAVSHVSLWEIVIKESTKTPMVGTSDAFRWFTDAMAATDFSALQIGAREIGAVQGLPMHHRDPFDRLLVAQATATHRTLVSRDGTLPAYDIDVGWWT